MGMLILYVTTSVIFAIFTVLMWKHAHAKTGSRSIDLVFRIVMTGLFGLSTLICAGVAIVEWLKSYQ